MACNSCNACGNVQGITFPDFVANSCCNPCCESAVAGQSTGGCGCGSVAGTSTGCGCNSCGNVAGTSTGCGGNVAGTSNGCGCGCSSCNVCSRYPWLPGCNTR